MDPDHELDRHDRERALDHRLDRIAPSRKESWPKDDRRSSSRLEAGRAYLTDNERDSAWPIG
jgi:hypothetical protein